MFHAEIISSLVQCLLKSQILGHPVYVYVFVFTHIHYKHFLGNNDITSLTCVIVFIQKLDISDKENHWHYNVLTADLYILASPQFYLSCELMWQQKPFSLATSVKYCHSEETINRKALSYILSCSDL